MIDVSKIARASVLNAKENWDCDGARFPAMCAFVEGAEWAQQEFIKSLWHDASEEPERYDDYLVKTKQGCIDHCFFDMNGWHKPKIGGGDVSQWLDLSDILPAKGGEE